MDSYDIHYNYIIERIYNMYLTDIKVHAILPPPWHFSHKPQPTVV